MLIDLIERHTLGPIQLREVDEAGDYHRRVISPGADVSGETPEVQAACAEHWTPERVAAWLAAQAVSEE
ncbi:hypothetical protein [Zavarzinia aquatilis]|uniref:Uncharacterized protein n=1 Tax=Zavarzinia aquatilis TaxID=2211142 RepID=A0A317EEE8_9PROT|nr:hypothetical protein [Zavarzinia aquatilis]PWR24992.1 hypothetical protein DKG74_04275 [Zavarzinia aquatilis]